jgi:hypothetical protein
MKSRIGLFTPAAPKPGKKKGESTTASYVEVETLAELSAALAKLNAKQVALFWRDNVGAGHVEGAMFPLASLGADHLQWVTAKTETFQMRGLFYETA